MKRYILFLLATLLSAAVSGQTAARTDSLAQHPQSEQTASAAYASDPDKLWDQANTAYINNDFPTAISLYETILSSGRQSGKLYYNLANAYFKEQEIGRAILNYNRALRLNPGNEDIRYNLQVAEKMTKDHIDAVPEFFRQNLVVESAQPFEQHDMGRPLAGLPGGNARLGAFSTCSPVVWYDAKIDSTAPRQPFCCWY